MATVLCVGIATLDHVYAVDAFPARAEKHRAADLAVVGGGIAANAAVAVARLGGRALLAARLGDDDAGTAILSGLAGEGVDCAPSMRLPGRRSPMSAILVDPAGERIVVSYSDPGMPAAGFGPGLPRGVDAVLGDTRWPEGAAAAFRLARATGLPAVLDADRAPDPDVYAAASHVAFAEQGLREATGCADPSEGLKRLAGRQAPWLAVTLGARGALVLEGERVEHHPAFPVDAVDTLAAGDTWHGAFALALAEGRPAVAALRFASAAAAIKCTRFGGRTGIPSRPEVEAFLAANGLLTAGVAGPRTRPPGAAEQGPL
jgi:sulfofructose kinase